MPDLLANSIDPLNHLLGEEPRNLWGIGEHFDARHERLWRQ
jgi:hypothetical protein